MRLQNVLNPIKEEIVRDLINKKMRRPEIMKLLHIGPKKFSDIFNDEKPYNKY